MLPCDSGLFVITHASFTRYRVAKLSEPSTIISYPLKISITLLAFSRSTYVFTSISGFRLLTNCFADSTLGFPTLPPCITCLWRLLRSTVSSSIIPIVPTPAAARYSITGEPSPPAPMHNTFDESNFFCPFPPTSGKMICREYLLICSSLNPPIIVLSPYYYCWYYLHHKSITSINNFW